MRSVPRVAPILLPFRINAAGMEQINWNPNGIRQPKNIPIAQPLAIYSGEAFSLTIFIYREKHFLLHQCFKFIRPILVL